MKFDVEKDYFAELKKDEIFEKEGKQFPLLRGLQRLAHTYRDGVKEVESNIIHVPARENPIAAVTVRYFFKDNTIFSGSADATTKAHEAPFNLHLVAMAESKAEARALRRAFNISKVAFEEIGSPNRPIESIQVSGLLKVGKRKGLKEKDILKLINSKATSLNELTASEGRDAMRKINAKK